MRGATHDYFQNLSIIGIIVSMDFIQASDVLFLSPHLDDVILSCGGHVWQLARAGTVPRIATVFTATPDAAAYSFPFAQYQHHLWGDPPTPMLLRQHEDRAAGVRLGINDMIHLPMPDAVYRQTPDGEPLYSSNDALFGALHPADDAFVDHIMAALKPHVRTHTTVVAPLGIGHHVDHQLVRDAGDRLLDAGSTVIFYEELPYAEDADASTTVTVDMDPSLIAVSDDAMAAKLHALHYYQTQIPVLYETVARMNTRVRAYAAGIAPADIAYAERVWTPKAV